MAMREDFSQGLSSNNSSDTSGLEAQAGGAANASAAAEIQLAQANTGGQPTENQVFDLANAPVKATFTSTKATFTLPSTKSPVNE